MILLDTTSASSWRHTSGLARVSRRLQEELGSAAASGTWSELASRACKGDWILTPELFSEHERPGFTAFLDARPCRVAAIYHDAIPIKLPAITWPKSVERHPSYMKLLARFDRIWAVSAASRARCCPQSSSGLLLFTWCARNVIAMLSDVTHASPLACSFVTPAPK